MIEPTMRNLNLLVFLTMLLSLALLNSSANAQPSYKANWVLIYENDEEGKRVQGSKDQLIKAIQNGEVVRVSWVHLISPDPLQKVEHLVEAAYLTIMNDETVLAQIDPIMSQSPDFEGKHIILTENVEMGLVVSTSGRNNYVRRNMITGEIIDRGSGKRAYKWFIHK